LRHILRYLGNPNLQPAVERLVAAYRQIGNERLHGLPIFNARLEVEAVGFTPWEGHLLGVLITPWFMNLILLPGEQAEGYDLKLGASKSWTLPSGSYEFCACPAENAGPHQSSPLFSTVVDFPTQELARTIAREIMDRVLLPAMDEQTTAEGLPNREESKSVTRRDLMRNIVLRKK